MLFDVTSDLPISFRPMPSGRPIHGSREISNGDGRVVAAHRLRHRLPSNRAVVGGLLVTIAATGVFVAHRSAATPPTDRYVVLTRTVEPGAIVTGDDLGTVALDLPDGLGVVGAERIDEVVGRTAGVRLDELDLLRPQDLLDSGRFTGPGSVEVAIELGAARALEGTIAAGSIVDVLVTDPAGAGTSTAAAGVRVTGVEAPDGTGIGTGGTVVVRLALADAEGARAVVDAAIRAEVTLALPAPGDEPVGPATEEPAT